MRALVMLWRDVGRNAKAANENAAAEESVNKTLKASAY